MPNGDYSPLRIDLEGDAQWGNEEDPLPVLPRFTLVFWIVSQLLLDAVRGQGDRLPLGRVALHPRGG
jgi:hypothetical protein